MGVACGATGAGAFAIACAIATAPMGGCTTHQCDKSCELLGSPPSTPIDNCTVQGASGNVHMEGVDLTWESNSQDGKWLDFPGQRTYWITYPQPFACPPELSAQVAANENNPQNNWVTVGGSLVEYFDASATGIGVINPTCAKYGLRIVARGIPATARVAWCVDGGASPLAEAGEIDAGSE
ncbi:MAG: hypothetical protein M3O46_12660 [Myxococcota bacterium]|nr:hypothetical protein [Myxococcota bacterium]